jgi:hypothetical protein
MSQDRTIEQTFYYGDAWIVRRADGSLVPNMAVGPRYFYFPSLAAAKIAKVI